MHASRAGVQHVGESHRAAGLNYEQPLNELDGVVAR